MPGRIIQAIKRCGTRNPVFVLVERIDQVLEEALRPAEELQEQAFDVSQAAL